MERQPVVSSNVASVGFDEASQVLEIEFRNGAVYQYQGAEAAKHHAALMKSEKKGTYIAQLLRHDKSLAVTKVPQAWTP